MSPTGKLAVDCWAGYDLASPISKPSLPMPSTKAETLRGSCARDDYEPRIANRKDRALKVVALTWIVE